MRRSLVLLAVLAGCGGSSPPSPSRPAAVATPRPALTAQHACGAATCSTLRVPLDRSSRAGESLALDVAVDGPPGAPVVVFLSGGPGEPGVPFLGRMRTWLGPVARRVRLVAFDQRGTGEDALKCPQLQREMGASDLTPPTRAAVEDCATGLGA